MSLEHLVMPKNRKFLMGECERLPKLVSRGSVRTSEIMTVMNDSREESLKEIPQ